MVFFKEMVNTQYLCDVDHLVQVITGDTGHKYMSEYNQIVVHSTVVHPSESHENVHVPHVHEFQVHCVPLSCCSDIVRDKDKGDTYHTNHSTMNAILIIQ